MLSPALGGIVIGQEVGRALGVRAIFAERQDGQSHAPARVHAVGADRVLVVEDVITTGGSTREAADVATDAGAHVVGAAAIIDRSRDLTRLNLPLFALVKMEVAAYQPESCPLCARDVPVSKPGSRS